MTTDAKPVRPIGTVKIGTPLLVGILLVIAAPVVTVWSGVADPGRAETSGVSLAGPVTSVVVDGVNGSVKVTADQSVSGVSGKATIDWHGAKPQLQETVKDGVATLSFSRPPDTDSGVSWEITVPPTAAVNVTTSNGSVRLTGVAGAVTAVTSNASIRADHLGSGPASFRTVNGDIDAAFTGAPDTIKAESSNANVTITTDGRTQYFDKTKTSNGNVERDNAGSEDYTLATTRFVDVRTSNGNIMIR